MANFEPLPAEDLQLTLNRMAKECADLKRQGFSERKALGAPFRVAGLLRRFPIDAIRFLLLPPVLVLVLGFSPLLLEFIARFLRVFLV